MRLASTSAAIAALALLPPFAHAQSQFDFQIDGVPAGSAQSFIAKELTLSKAERRQEDPDGSSIWWKVMVPGLPWYPATMRVSWDLPEPMLVWINDGLQANSYRKHTRTFEKKKDSDIISRQWDHFDVFIDEIVFPGFDKDPKRPAPTSDPNLIGLGLRAKGIITTKPGGSNPSISGKKGLVTVEFTLSDTSSDPVTVEFTRLTPIRVKANDGLNDGEGKPLARMVTVDDLELTIPPNSYAYFNAWFQETVASAPLTDPTDDGARLKRNAKITYFLSDGTSVALTLEGLGILGIQPAGADFVVRTYVDRVKLMNKQ